jgi:hypothetical protein
MAKKMPEIGDYKYGFADKDVSIFRSKRGLTSDIVKEISMGRRYVIIKFRRNHLLC